VNPAVITVDGIPESPSHISPSVSSATPLAVLLNQAGDAGNETDYGFSEWEELAEDVAHVSAENSNAEQIQTQIQNAEVVRNTAAATSSSSSSSSSSSITNAEAGTGDLSSNSQDYDIGTEFDPYLIKPKPTLASPATAFSLTSSSAFPSSSSSSSSSSFPSSSSSSTSSSTLNPNAVGGGFGSGLQLSTEELEAMHNLHGDFEASPYCSLCGLEYTVPGAGNAESARLPKLLPCLHTFCSQVPFVFLFVFVFLFPFLFLPLYP